MVMINMAGEAGRTSPYHTMGSPKYGGCVASFLHFFDWNPAKHFSSIMRLPENKPERAMQQSRSVRSDHGLVGKSPRMLQAYDAQPDSEEDIKDHAPETHHDNDASTRAPGIVARLMGLESLPDVASYQRPQPHRRYQSYTGGEEFSFGINLDRTPMLLQDLLERDFRSSRRTLRDRMPGFAKRAQEQHIGRRSTRKGAEGRQEEVVSAYMDISGLQHRKSGGNSSFHSRLSPLTLSQRTSPLRPSKMHTPRESPVLLNLEEKNPISELTLRQGVGWPLAGQRTRDLDHKSIAHEASFRSESDRSCECNPKPSNGRQAWNGSEGSDSTTDLEQVREFRAGIQKISHRKQGLVRESSNFKNVSSSSSEKCLQKSPYEASVREFKTSGIRSPLISPKLAAAQSFRSSSTAKAIFSSKELGLSPVQSRRRSADSSQKISRTSSASLESTLSQISNLISNTTLLPISSEPPATASKTGRPSPKSTQTNAKADVMAVKSMSKALPHGKPPPLDGYRTPKARNPKAGQGNTTPVVSGSRVFPSAGSPSRAESESFLSYGRVLAVQKEVDKESAVGKTKSGEQEMKTMPQPSPKITLQGIQRVREKVLPTTSSASLVDRLQLKDMAAQDSCGMVSKHARAQSVDEVFPELPFDFDHPSAFTSSICEMDMTMSDEQQVSDSLSRSIQCMFGQGLTHFDHFTGSVKRRIDRSSSGMIDCEEANSPVDEFRWVREILVDQQRVSSPLGGCCERSCSGPSISSVSVDAISDVDDERNGDAWSACASYNPADCDSPRTFKLPDTDADSDLPEQRPATPMFGKRIAEKSDGATTTEEAGQPSPVSILDSPFHDEACTTSESNLTVSGADSHRQYNADDGSKSCYSDKDKIRQALLDISMFQSVEAFTFKYTERIAPSGGPEEEQNFVREILSAAHFLSTPGSSPNWFNRDLAIDPSLFDRLELGNDMDGGVEKLSHVSGGLWRCDRKLLFDCVNEVFAFILWRYQDPESGLIQPRGQELVEEVYKKINEWRKLASLGTDSLIERDMCIHFGRWKDFSAEVAEVGLDIESVLWTAIVEEAVFDILSTSKRNRRDGF